MSTRQLQISSCTDIAAFFEQPAGMLAMDVLREFGCGQLHVLRTKQDFGELPSGTVLIYVILEATFPLEHSIVYAPESLSSGDPRHVRYRMELEGRGYFRDDLRAVFVSAHHRSTDDKQALRRVLEELFTTEPVQ